MFCKINFSPSFASQIKENRKPITRGLDYSSETIKNAEVDAEGDIYVVNRIPRTISNVDRFIKSSGKEVSIEDREDMIQEAILANLEKARKPEFSKSDRQVETIFKTERAAAQNVQKEQERQEEIKTLFPDESCTIEDCIANIDGEKSTEFVIRNALNTLWPREEEVIKLRYAIDGGQPLTYAEIGKMFNISDSRAQQIHNMGARRLRHHTRRSYLQRHIFRAPNGKLYSLDKVNKKANALTALSEYGKTYSSDTSNKKSEDKS